MKRVIVQPADLSGDATNDLKQWLGITRDVEDAQLTALLQASLELCEAYTGQVPIEVACEETRAAQFQWARLSATPVRAITAIDRLAAPGIRTTLSAADYGIDIDAEAQGSFRILSGDRDMQVVVSYIAGIAPDWSALPTPLKHGIIRLAAHHYLTRDKSDVGAPPAAVTALWRPWKQVRLK